MYPLSFQNSQLPSIKIVSVSSSARLIHYMPLSFQSSEPIINGSYVSEFEIEVVTYIASVLSMVVLSISFVTLVGSK